MPVLTMYKQPQLATMPRRNRAEDFGFGLGWRSWEDWESCVGLFGRGLRVWVLWNVARGWERGLYVSFLLLFRELITNRTGHLASALFLSWPGLPILAVQNDGFPRCRSQLHLCHLHWSQISRPRSIQPDSTFRTAEPATSLVVILLAKQEEEEGGWEMNKKKRKT